MLIISIDAFSYFIGLIIIFIISFILAMLPVFINFCIRRNDTSINNIDKLDSYECGFKTFSDVNYEKFYIHFFLLSLIFLIFDLEILYLIPLANIGFLSFLDFCICFIFFTILTAGLIVEYYFNTI